MRGIKNQDKPSTTNILPPCRVCGEPGTGFHYGVNTCGACKGFFRRSLRRQQPYGCIRCELCRVGPNIPRNKTCPKCRYDKCIAVGMRREACKLGRYSTAKKSENIKEAMEEIQSFSPSSASIIPNLENITECHPCQPQSEFETCPSPITYMDATIEGHYSQSTTNGTNFLNERDQSLYTGGSGLQGYCKTQDIQRTLEDLEEPHNLYRIGSALVGCDPEHDSMSTSSIASSGFAVLDPTNINSQTSKHSLYSQTASPDLPMYLHNSQYMYNPPSINTPSFTVVQQCNASDQSEYGDESMRCTRYGTKDSSLTHKLNVSSTITPSIDHFTNSTFISSTGFKGGDDTDIDSANVPTFASFENGVQASTNMTPSLPSQTLSPGTLVSRFLRDTQINQTRMSISSHLLPPQDRTSDFESCISPHSFPLPLRSIEDEYALSDNNISSNTIDSVHSISSIDAPPSPACLHDQRGACDNKMNLSEFQTNRNPLPSNSKRLPEPIDDENQLNTKKYQPNTKPHPITLYVVAPDPMKYVLSIFHRFPYICFERQSLAPLLSLCYNSTDSLDEYLHEPIVQKEPNVAANQRATPAFQSNSLLSSLHLTELTTAPLDHTCGDLELDNLFEYLQTAYTHYFDHGPDVDAGNHLDMFHKICQLHESLKMTLSLVDDDKYLMALKTTGLDVDRRKEFFECLTQRFDEHIMKEIRFYRVLPGFKALTLNDRVNLTKSTLLTSMSFSFIGAVDIERDIAICFKTGRASRISTSMRICGNGQLKPGYERFMKDYHDLGMTFKETIILKAYLMMCPDYCEDLEDPEIVTKWNGIYLKCLLRHYRKSYGPNADDKIEKLFRLTETVKSIRHDIIESRHSMSNVMECLIDGNKRPLLRELYVI